MSENYNPTGIRQVTRACRVALTTGTEKNRFWTFSNGRNPRWGKSAKATFKKVAPLPF